MSASLELEIKYLLTQEESLVKVIEQVIQTVENNDEPDYDQIVTLCRFLWRARAYKELCQFILKHWNRADFKIPWPYFLAALAGRINPEIAELLWQGINQENSKGLAARSHILDEYYPELKKIRADYKIDAIKKAEAQKEEFLNQLETFRVQQMTEQEKNLLQKMMHLYPDDVSIVRQSSDFRERNALEIISRHAPLRRATILEKDIKSPEMEKAREVWGQVLLEAAVTNASSSYEYAVAAFMMGLYEVSLKILDLTPQSDAKTWFRLEILLHARRYLDLLQDVANAELRYAHDSETFFATAYYRAQAFWGLGQKHLAIEVMEGLLAARPHYRMGLTLLTQWRGS